MQKFRDKYLLQFVLYQIFFNNYTGVYLEILLALHFILYKLLGNTPIILFHLCNNGDLTGNVINYSLFLEAFNYSR